MEKSTVHYPWFKKEDMDGFFALFQNNLADFVIIAVAMLGMGFPKEIVFGKVIPGGAIAVLVGNLYYAYTANRLAKKEGRSDVTALAYGISTPVMFVFLFGVLLPAKTMVGDAELAWKIAVGACLVSGLIEIAVSFIGRWIHKHIPRAAMLGALAGIALAFIAGEMLFKTLEIPVVGLVVLAIVIVGIIGKISMPFNIPASLFAIIIGTVIAYGMGQSGFSQIKEGLGDIGFYPFLPTTAAFSGTALLFTTMTAVLAVVIPITIYNAVETMNNVEAVGSMGDQYDVKECMAVDGVGTVLGTLFGGAFPTTVYMASVGSKWMGAGRGYSILNGIVYVFAAMFGLIAAISSIIPVSAIAPIMVFVGISMIATAFQSNKEKYFMAVSIAMLPYFGNYIMTRFNSDAGEVVGGISSGIVPLGQGAMFSGIILGAITVYVIDHEFKKAAMFAMIGVLFSFFGVMHAPKLAFNAAPMYTIGYLLIAAYFVYYAYKGVRTLPEKELQDVLIEKKSG